MVEEEPFVCPALQWGLCRSQICIRCRPCSALIDNSYLWVHRASWNRRCAPVHFGGCLLGDGSLVALVMSVLDFLSFWESKRLSVANPQAWWQIASSCVPFPSPFGFIGHMNWCSGSLADSSFKWRSWYTWSWTCSSFLLISCCASVSSKWCLPTDAVDFWRGTAALALTIGGLVCLLYLWTWASCCCFALTASEKELGRLSADLVLSFGLKELLSLELLYV